MSYRCFFLLEIRHFPSWCGRAAVAAEAPPTAADVSGGLLGLAPPTGAELAATECPPGRQLLCPDILPSKGDNYFYICKTLPATPR